MTFHVEFTALSSRDALKILDEDPSLPAEVLDCLRRLLVPHERIAAVYVRAIGTLWDRDVEGSGTEILVRRHQIRRPCELEVEEQDPADEVA